MYVRYDSCDSPVCSCVDGQLKIVTVPEQRPCQPPVLPYCDSIVHRSGLAGPGFDGPSTSRAVCLSCCPEKRHLACVTPLSLSLSLSLRRAPTLAGWGSVGTVTLLFATDWQVIMGYVPYINGKFKKDE
ncbi:QCR10 protein, partial [Amia calva]|nr:QCR10 protein [Amia calva]